MRPINPASMVKASMGTGNPRIPVRFFISFLLLPSRIPLAGFMMLSVDSPLPLEPWRRGNRRPSVPPRRSGRGRERPGAHRRPGEPSGGSTGLFSRPGSRCPGCSCVLFPGHSWFSLHKRSALRARCRFFRFTHGLSPAHLSRPLPDPSRSDTPQPLGIAMKAASAPCRKNAIASVERQPRCL